MKTTKDKYLEVANTIKSKKDWLAKAKELDVESEKYRTRKEESFADCDTDGFLTQSIQSDCAHMSEENARICRQSGKDVFIGLYSGNRRIKAKLIKNHNPFSHQDGWVWLIDKDESIDRRYVPFNNCKGTGRILKKLGLTEEKEIADGWADFAERSIAVYRMGCEWGLDSKKLNGEAKC
jgi:hypothetical protein|tara:strand:- start:28 stop:564 length:537 start_codon:yes stop_codon:yes gene_type:complete